MLQSVLDVGHGLVGTGGERQSLKREVTAPNSLGVRRLH